MNAAETEFINEVDEKETQEVLHVLASSLMFNSSASTEGELKNKSIFITFFSNALEKVMQNDVVKSKSDRLKVIKYLDKLKQQKEAIEFATGNKANLKIAAERLGRKAQSAFNSSRPKK